MTDEPVEMAPSIPEEFQPSPNYRTAFALAFTLIVATAIAAVYSGVQWPVSMPFIPVAATLWIICELLTAVLLFSRFIVTGSIPFAVFGALFAFTTILTATYLVLFPGVFRERPIFGSMQSSIWLWLIWHAGFALMSGAYVVCKRRFQLQCHNTAEIQRVCRFSVIGTLAVSAIISMCVISCAGALPALLVTGNFTSVFRLAALGIALLSGAAAVGMFAGPHRCHTLELWMSVALLSEGLDALLNAASQGRYTVGWYIGKYETTVTSAVVLIALLYEIVALYRRSNDQAEELNVALRRSRAAGRLLDQDNKARKYAEAALRASDQLFRQVEERVAIGLALIALDGRITRVNPALCTITGYGIQELLFKSHHSLVHPDDMDGDQADFARLINKLSPAFEIERRYLNKESYVVWVLLSVTLVCDDVGQPLYFIAQSHDISGRRAAEDELRAAQEAALAGSEAKSSFLSTMSHEVRTPLNGIIGMTELLELSELSPQQQECVQVIRDSGQSLLQLVNDILDYSKVEAGKLDIEFLDFDLIKEIRSVKALFEPQFGLKHVALSTALSVDLPVMLNSDPSRVRQILVNLVGNALKFTPEHGTVRILAAKEITACQVTSIRFTVEDTGIGIASDERHKLFQPFCQLDSSTTRLYGGTGLGLSICKQLVELLGGSIGVTSTVGLGSSFWFTIPFAAASAPSGVDDARSMRGNLPQETSPSYPMRLLLAEDNPINALVAVKQFKRLGFDIEVVSNGLKAVEATQRHHFDAVFMDCQMPVLDGFDATREIRRLNKGSEYRVPIVAMTANARPEDRLACLEAGMDDYICKPAELSDLAAILKRYPSTKPKGE